MATPVKSADGNPAADHFCLLVHGLWGNPSHLDVVSAQLRKKYGDRIYILNARSNADSYTYDGIAIGGERVVQELEEELRQLKTKGYHFTKISVVGYSLGGLIARYCVGLLYARGLFERLEPVNFTAIASPFLGARAPAKWYHSRLWNTIAASTVSESGRQMFLEDKFRDTGRPLLSLMADPNSIFMKGLGSFRNRVLYANIVNDRLVPFHTAGISRTNPFTDLDAVNMRYVRGYDTVVLDPERPVTFRGEDEEEMEAKPLGQRASDAWQRMRFYAFFITLFPIIGTSFFVYSGIQSFKSTKRIRSHNEGELSSLFDMYRFPVMAKAAIESGRAAAEEMAENIAEGSAPSETASHSQSRSKPQPHAHIAPNVNEAIEKIAEDAAAAAHAGVEAHPEHVLATQQNAAATFSADSLLSTATTSTSGNNNGQNSDDNASRVASLDTPLSSPSLSGLPSRSGSPKPSSSSSTSFSRFASTLRGRKCEKKNDNRNATANGTETDSDSSRHERQRPLHEGEKDLDLTPEQFEMIDNLNALGFKKYPVWISKHQHSHAAIIVRRKGEAFAEGYTVLKHWLEEEFEV